MTDKRSPASLIYNPQAGRRAHAAAIDAILAALGSTHDITVRPTTTPTETTLLARESAQHGDSAVFAWGGDGTVRDVAAGLLGSPTCLGVLAGGTFNVIARSMGLPNDPAKAARILASAVPSTRDVGLIDSTPFLMQATSGLDAFIVQNLNADRKARFGRGAALLDGLRAYARYRFRPFEVDVDGTVHTVTGAAFVNLPEYGGPYQLVPDGSWGDQRSHAVLYTGRTHLAALMYTCGIILGTHHRRADVKIHEAGNLVFRDRTVPIQIDGDGWTGPGPAACSLSSQRIQVLIPEPEASVKRP